MIYYCENCGEFIGENQVENVCVNPQTWDSPAEWEVHCPYCGAENLEEAKTCEFCGEPIDPYKKINFCDDCEDYFTYMFNKIIEAVADEWGCDKEHAKQAFLEFIAEKY